MIYLLMLALAAVLLLPLGFALFGRGAIRVRRDTAVKLHRAQLAELARDLTDNRIAATEYAAAKLEIERRLLLADALREPPLNGNAKLLLAATILAVPLMAFALYLPGSTPTVPSEPHAKWVAQQARANAGLIGLIAALRMRIAAAPPNSVYASQGEAYLAEALSEAAGGITPEALSYFRQSLADAPPNASWRPLDEARLAQAAGQ